MSSRTLLWNQRRLKQSETQRKRISSALSSETFGTEESWAVDIFIAGNCKTSVQFLCSCRIDYGQETDRAFILHSNMAVKWMHTLTCTLKSECKWTMESTCTPQMEWNRTKREFGIHSPCKNEMNVEDDIYFYSSNGVEMNAAFPWFSAFWSQNLVAASTWCPVPCLNGIYNPWLF